MDLSKLRAGDPRGAASARSAYVLAIDTPWSLGEIPAFNHDRHLSKAI